MKKMWVFALLLCMVLACVVAGFAKDGELIKPSIYIKPPVADNDSAADDNDNSEFAASLNEAFLKKETPVTVVETEEESDYILDSIVEAVEAPKGAKKLRCMIHCKEGWFGNNKTSIRLFNRETQEVVWAYNVEKYGALLTGVGKDKDSRRSAEAIAKHLKKFVEKNQQMFISDRQK